MSKKISIPSHNIRSYLHDLFHEYLDEQYSLENESYDKYDYMDDDDVYWLMRQGYLPFDDMDDGDVLWPILSTKGKSGRETSKSYVNYFKKEDSKKKKYKHKKGAKVIEFAPSYDIADDEYNDGNSKLDDGKLIYFYPNYATKEDRIEFESLLAFDEFCCDNGYAVAQDACIQLAYDEVSHCCLNPSLRERGIMEVIAQDSYADMVYEACEYCELG